MSVGRAWHWPLVSAKPIPLGTRFTLECQQNIASSIRSMHLQWSAGQIFVTQWLVCAGRPGKLGGLQAGGSDPQQPRKLLLAQLPRSSTLDNGQPSSPRSSRLKLPGALIHALTPVPPTGSRMPARVLTSCCDPIVAGSTESIASVIRTTRPSVTRT